MSDPRRHDQMEGLISDLGETPDAPTNTPRSTRRSGRPPHRQRRQQHLPAASQFDIGPSQDTSASQKSKEVPQQRAPKVAIPRLQRGLETAAPIVPSFAEDKSRVSHACEPCRHRKTKCSGEKPTCQHCEEFKIACVYGDRKREKSRKEIKAMARRLDEYEKLLQSLMLRVDENDQRLIRKTFERDFPSEDDESLPQSSIKSTTGSTSSVPGNLAEETNPEADRATQGGVDDEMSSEGGDGTPHLTRIGSTRSLGHVNEDFNRTAASRATGFMGKNSEVTWMQRLRKEADVSAAFGEETIPMLDSPSFKGNPQYPINESTYRLDDLSMLVLDHVEPYEVPPRHIADRLFEHYLDTVHPAFPIIGKTTFLDQYRTYYSKNVQAGANWLAILNLIFAIGAKYSCLIRAEWGGKEGDDLIYFTRARLLGFNTDSILNHAGLQSVQVAGLIAFYLTAINQINRAWTFSGIAMRHAFSLGLNLKNNSQGISDSSKEIRYRVWWAVCSAEFRLSAMNGRSSAFLSANCTAPLPRPVEEETFFLPRNTAFENQEDQSQPCHLIGESPSIDGARPNQPSSSSARMTASPMESSGPTSSPHSIPSSHALYFLLQTKLGLITNEVLDQLYRPKTVTRSWAHVQLIISALAAKLEQWRTDLPFIFDFSKRQRDQQFGQQRMCLGFFFYSTVMIISRPCLCRMNRTMPRTSEKSKEFDRATAAKCVHAAKDMLNLLPNQPNPFGLYKVAPWWCVVHHLVQASTVSMLELSFQADHVPEEVDHILQTAKKAAHWLRSMAETDLAASRAWRLCEGMLHKVASIVGKPFDQFPPSGLSDAGGPGAGDILSDHSYPASVAGPGSAAHASGHYPLIYPPDEYEQQNPYGGEWPLQAQIYTSYDEIFPPSFQPAVAVTGPESHSDFLSMYPTPDQMEGFLIGDLDDLSMTNYDPGGS